MKTLLVGDLSINNLAGQGCFWLLDATLKGMILLALAGAALTAMRRASAAARQWVLLVALAGVLVLPAAPALLPGWRVLPAWARMDAITGASPLDRTPASGGAEPVILQRENADISGIPEREVAPSVETLAPESPTPMVAGQAASTATVPARSVTGLAKPAASEGRWSVATWALSVWAVGVLVVLLPLALGRLAMARRRREGQVMESGAIYEHFKKARKDLGLRRQIELVVSPRRLMPMVWGIFRPTLLLPVEAANWSASRLRAVLGHELGHIRRHDVATQTLGRVACALYWFNPLAWVAFGRFQCEAERACDDLVLKSGHDASDYAQHILEMASGLRMGLLATQGSLAAARRSKLEGRLTSILDSRLNRRTMGWGPALGAILAGIGVLLPLSVLQAKPPVAAVQGASGTRATGTSAGTREAATGPATTQAADEVWGEPSEGMKVRLTLDKKTGLLHVQARNDGPLDLMDVAWAQEGVELEVDGMWYRWKPGVSVKISDFKRGVQLKDVTVTLAGDWEEKKDGEPYAFYAGYVSMGERAHWP